MIGPVAATIMFIIAIIAIIIIIIIIIINVNVIIIKLWGLSKQFSWSQF